MSICHSGRGAFGAFREVRFLWSLTVVIAVHLADSDVSLRTWGTRLAVMWSVKSRYPTSVGITIAREGSVSAC
jgi:hypothetical protein